MRRRHQHVFRTVSVSWGVRVTLLGPDGSAAGVIAPIGQESAV